MQFIIPAFILIPILEIVLLIQVGGAIGLWPTVGLILLTAFVGAGLLRAQGLLTLKNIQQRMDAGELPAKELIGGALIAVGGALLLTPGFFTDFMGLMCLLPGSRHAIIHYILKRAVVSVAYQSQASWTQSPSSSSHQQGDIIEGEYSRDSEKIK